MNLPLYLTLSRVLLGPVFMAVYLYYQEMGIPLVWLPFCLIFLAILSELSDLFDGFLARRHNKVTELGKILDPMADSIFRLQSDRVKKNPLFPHFRQLQIPSTLLIKKEIPDQE